jgi:4-amino-4-deoxy-L-arabinose transferase-like glycosyltransferase
MREDPSQYGEVPAPGFLDGSLATFVIFVAGLIPRCLLLVFLAQMPLMNDARSYFQMGTSLAHGDSFVPYWPPGLPYFLAFLQSIGLSQGVVARVGMLTFHALFSLVLFKLVRLFASRRAANIALLLFAFYPSHVHMSVEPMTEMVAAAGLVLTVYLASLCVRRRALGWAALLGCVVGSLMLTRPSSILLVGVLPGWLWVRTRRVGPPVICLAISMVILSAWLVKTQRMVGSFVFINTANARNCFIGNNPHTPLYKTWWLGTHMAGEPGVPDAYVERASQIEALPPTERDQHYRAAAFSYILSRPDLFAIRCVNRMRNYFAFDTFTGALLISDYAVNKWLGLGIIAMDAVFFFSIMTLGLVQLFASRPEPLTNRYRGLLLVVVVAYALPYWIAFSHPRFHFPVVPLFGLLAAIMLSRITRDGIRKIVESLRRSRARRAGLGVSLLLIAYIQIEWIVVMYARF